MTASQDKVQGILESLLQQSIPLIHKGIFTPQQLRAAMHERQKHQNNMLKSTFKTSDYLKAIQFQYALQRKRRYIIDTQSKTNPLFKKQGKTDFVIVKRIIKLWDRTMHKYKYNVDLWKQYLQFCVTIGSKKQFYKALSAAIRVMPLCSQLWRIGVQYQMEIGLNMWKARKIFIKGLKMNPTDEQLWLDMLKFEIHFLRVINQRQKAIEGAEQAMKFIMPRQDNNEQQEQQNQLMQNEMEQQGNSSNMSINISEHDQVMLLVIQECLSKFEQTSKKRQLMNKFLQIVTNSIASQKDQDVIKILKRVQNNIKLVLNKFENNKQEPQIKQKHIKNNIVRGTKLSGIQQKFEYANSILNSNQTLTSQTLDKLIPQFLTRPHLLNKLVVPALQSNFDILLQYFATKSSLKSYCLPAQTLSCIIKQSFQAQQVMNKYGKYIDKQISMCSLQNLKNDPKLLQKIIEYNKKCNNHKINNDIYRKLSVGCRGEPEVVERCLHFIQSN